MKRAASILLTLLFVVGALILPTFHRAHCADSGDSHDATQCPVCQFASMPGMATSSHIAPSGLFIVVAHLCLPPSTVPCAVFRDRTQARAPPVA